MQGGFPAQDLDSQQEVSVDYLLSSCTSTSPDPSEGASLVSCNLCILDLGGTQKKHLKLVELMTPPAGRRSGKPVTPTTRAKLVL